jgi:low affinity Fe/Cu permease
MGRLTPSSWFTRFAKHTSWLSGRPLTFALALVVILVWATSGPLFDFSDTWQLVINTGTTIVTFLMVFLIQNTQSRDTEAVQVKLDELIRVTKGAHNALLNLEDVDDEKLARIREDYQKLAEKARPLLDAGYATPRPGGTRKPDKGPFRTRVAAGARGKK